MRIAILEPDPQARNATGVRGLAMARFLRRRGHRVEMLSLDRAAEKRIVRRVLGPAARLTRLTLGRRPRHWWDVFADEYARLLEGQSFDVVIGRGPEASYVLTRPLPYLKAFDLANITFLESYYVWGPDLGEVEAKFRREQEILNAVRIVITPHSHLSDVLVEAFPAVPGLREKIVLAPLGCDPSSHRARWSMSPRIVYAGSYFYIQDPYMLSRLSARSPFPIDCYGSTDPNRLFFPTPLNYRGFAPDLDFLANYQLGLITLSRDWLRCQSPATKFPAYFSYGLPVLFPEWMREGHDYADCAFPFDENSFQRRAREATKADTWARMSDAAWNRAAAMTWEKRLAPLDEALTRLDVSEGRA